MKTVKLNNGVEMPILGYGVFQIAPVETERCVTEALEAGYRSIDTAAAYMNEQAVGNAIAKSGIPREELFITTKLWVQDAGYKSAKKAFERSLKFLGVEYLDLYLIHQAFGDYYGAWRAMEELYKEGRIRAIGVSNFFNDRLLDLILNNEIVPAVNQIEVHPFLQQSERQDFMKQYGVQVEAWGPLAEGKNDIFNNPVIKAIGEKYGKSVAQVILRWLVERDVVVIPKTVSKYRMAENLDIFNFSLTGEDMEAIRTLDTGKSPIIDHFDPQIIKFINSKKIHE